MFLVRECVPQRVNGTVLISMLELTRASSLIALGKSEKNLGNTYQLDGSLIIVFEHECMQLKVSVAPIWMHRMHILVQSELMIWIFFSRIF